MKKERRKFPRRSQSPEEEKLFSEFRGLTSNAKDPYWQDYARRMMMVFAKLTRKNDMPKDDVKLPPLPADINKPSQVLDYARAAVLADRAQRTPPKVPKVPQKTEAGATYLNETTGYVMNDRREFLRTPDSEKTAELFNGFHNLLMNAEASGDGYTVGYITAMMKSLAEILRKQQ